MVERANGIIKKATILKEHYANKKEMNYDLIVFLAYFENLLTQIIHNKKTTP